MVSGPFYLRPEPGPASVGPQSSSGGSKTGLTATLFSVMKMYPEKNAAGEKHAFEIQGHVQL
jgi:hypothetical protein